MDALRIALLYALFAALATLANLGGQRLVLAVLGDGDAAFLLALCCGTGAGLVVKYVLDRRWIFARGFAQPAREAATFALYTLTGVFTTLLFWATEAAFWLTTRQHTWRELGALLGLCAGYALKYRLDRRFVFAAAGP
ncbi:hypothetical protein HRbin39_00297 [bacterium HR39]|nr:hypothetical protein HRbin39_00297 [bacterium HR39]